MLRCVAFLRGITPQNLKMADLAATLEAAGFGRVKTLLSSSNAAFDADGASLSEIEMMVRVCTDDLTAKSWQFVNHPLDTPNSLDGDVNSFSCKTQRLRLGKIPN